MAPVIVPERGSSGRARPLARARANWAVPRQIEVSLANGENTAKLIVRLWKDADPDIPIVKEAEAE